jgi:hypothetical protein
MERAGKKFLVRKQFLTVPRLITTVTGKMSPSLCESEERNRLTINGVLSRRDSINRSGKSSKHKTAEAQARTTR